MNNITFISKSQRHIKAFEQSCDNNIQLYTSLFTKVGSNTTNKLQTQHYEKEKKKQLDQLMSQNYRFSQTKISQAVIAQKLPEVKNCQKYSNLR